MQSSSTPPVTMSDEDAVAVRYSSWTTTPQRNSSSKCNSSTSSSSRYPSNITAACHAASAVAVVVSEVKSIHKAETQPGKLERRRKSNRLSARRWRNRKRCKLANLHGQICTLRKEFAQLEVEKCKLQKELATELELAKAESTHRDRQHGLQQSRCLQQQQQQQIHSLQRHKQYLLGKPNLAGSPTATTLTLHQGLLPLLYPSLSRSSSLMSMRGSCCYGTNEDNSTTNSAVFDRTNIPLFCTSSSTISRREINCSSGTNGAFSVRVGCDLEGCSFVGFHVK